MTATDQQAPATGEPSFVQDMGIKQNPEAAVGADVVNPLDVLDQVVDEEIEEGIDMKANNEFRVVFKRGESKKKLPLSEAAAELITKCNFARMLGVPVETAAEDAPKRRGRKPKAAADSAKKNKVINLEFVDDQKNVAIDFIESLTSYEPFRVFVTVNDDDGVDIERFTFKDVKIVPTSHFASFQSEHSPSGLRLNISLEYGSMSRKSLVSEGGAPASGE